MSVDLDSVLCLIANRSEELIKGCEDLMALVMSFSVPNLPHSFNGSEKDIDVISCFEEVVYLQMFKTTIAYKHMITSLKVEYSKTVSGDASLGVLISDQIRLGVTQLTDKCDDWRVWIKICAGPSGLIVSLLLSDAFLRKELSWELDGSKQFKLISPYVDLLGTRLHSEKGAFYINDVLFDLRGFFVYDFLSPIVALNNTTFFYTENDTLIRMLVDTANREIKSSEQLVYLTVNSVFSYKDGLVGMVAQKEVCNQFQTSLYMIDSDGASEFDAHYCELLANTSFRSAAFNSEEMKIILLTESGNKIVTLFPEFLLDLRLG